MYFPPYYYLSVDIFILFLQICSLTGNGLIIYFFFTNHRLRSQRQLRLVLSLAIADFFYAASSIPYIINFIAGWNTTELLYDGYLAVALAQPLVIHFKINLSIATGIAVDRLQAMRWPMYYRTKNTGRFNWAILAAGIFLALVDVCVEYSLGINQVVPGCNTIGCFVSHPFRLYWGVSNMVFNFLMLVLALFVIYDFKKLSMHRDRCTIVRKIKMIPTVSSNINMVGPSTLQSNSFGSGSGMNNVKVVNVVAGQTTNTGATTATSTNNKCTNKEAKERKNFNQANRLSVSILIISIIFLLIPSIFVGAIDYFGFQTFERLGPFYLVGLLLAGVSNGFAYILFHVELRASAYKFFGLQQRIQPSAVKNANEEN